MGLPQLTKFQPVRRLSFRLDNINGKIGDRLNPHREIQHMGRGEAWSHINFGKLDTWLRPCLAPTGPIACATNHVNDELNQRQQIDQPEEDDPHDVNEVPIDFGHFDAGMMFCAIVTLAARSPQHAQNQQQANKDV